MRLRFFIFSLFFATGVYAKPDCSILDSKIVEKQWLIELPESQLRLEPVHPNASGVNNDGVYQGSYKGREVVVKKIIPQVDIELVTVYRELTLYTQTSRLGISPEFFGVMKFADGGFGIVTQKISPSWIARTSGTKGNGIPEALKNASPKLRKTWYANMERIVKKVTQSNIHMYDMQFLITPSGKVYLIDMESYQRKTDPQALKDNYTDLLDFRNQILGNL